MEELKYLLKNNVDGDKTGLQDHVLSIFKNEAEVNALITWIKANSISKNVSVEDVLKEVYEIQSKI
jgi:hypothetical protein